VKATQIESLFYLFFCELKWSLIGFVVGPFNWNSKNFKLTGCLVIVVFPRTTPSNSPFNSLYSSLTAHQLINKQQRKRSEAKEKREEGKEDEWSSEVVSCGGSSSAAEGWAPSHNPLKKKTNAPRAAQLSFASLVFIFNWREMDSAQRGSSLILSLFSSAPFSAKKRWKKKEELSCPLSLLSQFHFVSSWNGKKKRN